MSQIGDLLELQALDTEYSSVAARIAEIDRDLAGNEALESARGRAAAAAAEVAALEREQRQVDDAATDLTARIAPEERRLYDGSVRNPKELTSIQQEVEHLKLRRAELEERELVLLERLDGARAEAEEADSVARETAGRWEEETAHLRAEREGLSARAAVLDERRATARGAVPRASLFLYDSLLGRKGGLAVTPVRGGACTGCRVLLPDAVRRRAATSQVPVQCPNCERILAAAG